MEYAISKQEYEKIRTLLYDESGISLGDSKQSLVVSRLTKRLRHLQLDGFASYYDYVTQDNSGEEFTRMLDLLSTNKTDFFREPKHFDFLRERILPSLEKDKQIRIWSSACSSGEEAYSIAMTILGVLPEAARLNVRVLATDIDSEVVATSRAGLYSAAAVEPIPATLKDRYVESTENGRCTIAADARALITFNTLNLMHDWPMKGSFDAIFCRNVAIYFSEETQTRLWQRFRPLLPEGGRLYVGHSERVGEAGFASDGLTTYKAVRA